MNEELVLKCTDPLELEAVHNGRTMAEDMSAFMFRLRAIYAPIVDDDRGIAHFPKLKLQTDWVYKDPPITRMTVAELAATVFGLQWLLLSDMYVMNRDEEWFGQFEAALGLVRSRAFYLVQHESQKTFLDEDKYVEKVEEEGAGEPEFDYDSDEERRVARRPVLDKSVEKLLDLPYRVNDAFVLDMDTSLRSMDEALFTRWALGPLEPIPMTDQRPIRNRVLNEFQAVTETTAVQYRREWIQKLLVVPSYVATHLRWYPHDRRINPRAILVVKNEKLADVSVPVSIMDIITPPSTTDKIVGPVETRLNADAALFYVSESVPNDDFIRRVNLGLVEWRNMPYHNGIGRFLAEQKWVVFVKGKAWTANSFTAAFLFFKQQTGDESLGRRLDL